MKLLLSCEWKSIRNQKNWMFWIEKLCNLEIEIEAIKREKDEN